MLNVEAAELEQQQEHTAAIAEPVLEVQIPEASQEEVYVKKPVYDFLKRMFDIVASFIALVLLSPFLLIVALAIMIDDFGNPFYSQMRTGKNGKEFKIYKFRSMYRDADDRKSELMQHNEADGPLFKMAEDPRITKVGRFIRKTSIDELPQLVNILKGEMSIIGPRPFVTEEQEQCNEYQAQRLLVKPGLSCYSALDSSAKENFDKWIELDLKYIRERSPMVDMKIILRTLGVVLRHKNY